MEFRKNNKTGITKLLERIFFGYWWVLLFLLICYVGYNTGIKKRNKAIYDIKCKYNNLLTEKQIIYAQKGRLEKYAREIRGSLVKARKQRQQQKKRKEEEEEEKKS